MSFWSCAADLVQPSKRAEYIYGREHRSLAEQSNIDGTPQSQTPNTLNLQSGSRCRNSQTTKIYINWQDRKIALQFHLNIPRIISKKEGDSTLNLDRTLPHSTRTIQIRKRASPSLEHPRCVPAENKANVFMMKSSKRFAPR